MSPDYLFVSACHAFSFVHSSLLLLSARRELCKQSYRRLELHLAEISFNTRNRDGGRGAKSNDRFPLKGMKFIQLKYTVKQGHSQCDCTMSRLVENTLDELLQKELTNTLYGYSQSLCFEIKEAKPPTDTGGPDGV